MQQRKTAQERFLDAEAKLRAKIAALQEQRAFSYTINGVDWCIEPNVKDGQVPAHYVDKWIKTAQIELGLLQGRWAEVAK